nr:hypothetical protein BaRGS_024183 [Batillaria attramentaria]
MAALARHRVVSIAAIACVVVAFIFHLVGVSAVGWVKFEGEYNSTTTMMMMMMMAVVVVVVVMVMMMMMIAVYHNIVAWLEAVQAFAILGVLVMVACLVCCGLPFCLTNSAFLRLEPSDNTTSDSNNGQTKRNTAISSRTGKTRPTRYRRAMMTLSVMFRKKF